MNPLLNMPRERKKGVRKKDFLEDRAFLQSKLKTETIEIEEK